MPPATRRESGLVAISQFWLLPSLEPLQAVRDMPVQSNDRLVRLFKSSASADGLTVLVLRVVVLVGWALGIDTRKTGIHGLDTIKANNALPFVFSGSSRVLLARNPA